MKSSKQAGFCRKDPVHKFSIPIATVGLWQTGMQSKWTLPLLNLDPYKGCIHPEIITLMYGN
jgi:hypothetical protein